MDSCTRGQRARRASGPCRGSVGCTRSPAGVCPRGGRRGPLGPARAILNRAPSVSSLPCGQSNIAGPTGLPDVGRGPPRPYFGRDRFLPEAASLTSDSSHHTIPLPEGARNMSTISSYGVPVLSVGAVLVISNALDVHLRDAPVSLFICAVMFSAWFGGFRSGLLATILSVLAFNYYFVPPIHSFAVHLTELPRAVVFALAAFFVGSLSARQRSAVEALRESEQRFRDYAETASDWLWETGPDHSFTRVSEELTTLGIDPPGRIGTMRWDLATDVAEEPEKWRRHVATLGAHQPFRGFVYRTAAADGSAVYMSTSGRPMFDADGGFRGYRGVTTDVTATVRAEQTEKALHQAQTELARVARVTTLGELTASIAHEINQPLAAIGADANACLHWLAADTPDLDKVREALNAIVKDGHRAGEVITRVRTLLARSSVAHEPCDLNGVIRDVLPLVGPEIERHGILLQTSLSPG